MVTLTVGCTRQSDGNLAKTEARWERGTPCRFFTSKHTMSATGVARSQQSMSLSLPQSIRSETGVSCGPRA